MERAVRRQLILEGLCCANCGAKIEKMVGELKGVSSASLNFTTKTLTFETEETKNDEVVEKIRKIVKSIEPDVKVIDAGRQRKGKAHEDQKDSDEELDKKEIMRLVVGAALLGTALASKLPFSVEFPIYLVSYLLVGGNVLIRACRNIARGQVFDENFLMAIATIGAFSIKKFPEGVSVILFYQIGELFQDIAVNRSRRSIAELMDIRPDFANLKSGENIKKVSPEEVNVGDLIVVKPGERVPLDGEVVDGWSMVDTSALTGESLPREVKEGSDILGGFINKNGLLTIQVTKEFGQSTVSKILDLVQNAGSKKAPTENFITKFARYYTPAVVFIALGLAVIPPIVLPGAHFSDWLYRALVFLVVSCPCALVVSIPLGFFGGIGGASKNGILVKGGNFLEALNDVDTVVFDKTGTLTKGVFKVTQVCPAEGVDGKELIEYAAYAEGYSNHPIAVSILQAYKKEVEKAQIEGYDEIPGYGIKAHVRGKEVLAGNIKLMENEGIHYQEVNGAGTAVHAAIDKNYAGYLLISDEIKEDSKKAIEALKKIGVKKTIMLTGDSKLVGDNIAGKLGVDEVYAELLPDQKVDKLEMIDREKSSKGRLVFMGDGINDAPVLARADIGVAMGGLGSDAAIEAADVVLMTDEPSKLVDAINIAKRTNKIVWQNIIFSLGIKIIVLLLGAVGIATMWAAVFADVGVTLIAVLNSMRAMRVDKTKLGKSGAYLGMVGNADSI